MSVQPKQRLSKAKKTLDWIKQNADFYISESSFSSKHKLNIKKFYEAYNGFIPEVEYNYVTDPYGRKQIPGAKPWNYPAKIRNFNILKPVIDLLMGEKSKRYMNFQVVVRNSDVVSKQEEAIAAQMTKLNEQLFVNELNNQGVPTGVDSQEVPAPEQAAQAIKSNYLDERAIMGQNAIDYLKDYNEVPEVHQRNFFDWLITGSCFTYKTVSNNEVFYEDISPMYLDADPSPGIENVEDGAWAIYRKEMLLSQVMDRFYDILDDAVVKEMDGGDQTRSSGGFFTALNNRETTPSNVGRMVEVYHIVWKTLTKRGELTYTDEVGQTQKMWVDEDYIVNKAAGETIKWHWLNEAYECYKIDGKHYVGYGPVEIQRNEMNNKSRCKLPYNGKFYSNRHADNISIIALGYYYNVLYNIYHYRFELTMAKSKDKIILMEYNAIPKKHGWDEDKFMYMADAMGFAFVDTVKDGKSTLGGFNQFQVLDASLGQYAASILDVLRSIKQEWEELVGFNAQRKGQSAASEGLGARQQSIFQSSVITEELFRKFEKWQEREYQGLLDVSKYAWKDGKKSGYITSDLRQILLDIDPISFQEAEYGIRAMNSGEENDHLKQLKDFAQAFAQNGSAPSTVAEILAANSIAKVTALLRKAEEAQQKMNAEQMKQEQVSAQQLEQMKQDALVAEREFQSSENALDRQNAYDMKSMDIEAKLLLDGETDENGESTGELAIKQEANNIKRQQLMDDMTKHREQLAELAKERLDKMRQADMDRQVSREDIQSRERIARMKPATTAAKK